MHQSLELSVNDLEIIKESLQYSRKNISEYQHHRDYEFKQKQLSRVNEVANKVQEILNLKKAAS